MSGTVTATDLGGAGGGSSDAALAPLIAALTDNSTQLVASTAKLGLLETVQQQLQTAVAALSSSIDKFISKIGSGKVGGGSSKVVDPEKEAVKAAKKAEADARREEAKIAAEERKAARAEAKRIKEQEAETKKIERAQNAAAKAAEELLYNELRWKVKEYKGRAKLAKQEDEYNSRIVNEGGKQAGKDADSLAGNILDQFAKSTKDQLKTSFEHGMAYGPSRIDYKLGKEKQKQEAARAQFNPVQEAHVEAFKQEKEFEAFAKAMEKQFDSGMDDERKGEAAAKRWREGLDKIQKMKEQEAIVAAAEEASARALWREGLERQAELKMEAAEKELAQVEANNAAWDKVMQDRIQDEVLEKAAANIWRAGLNKIQQMKEDAAANELAHSYGPTREEFEAAKERQKDSGSKFSSKNPLGSMVTMALDAMGPFGQAIGIGTVAIKAASAAFNMLRSSVDSLAKSAMNYAPGIAIAMERALKDLDAVVGVYSAKVGGAMIPIVRAVADYLFPMMKQLGDVVAKVVNAFAPFVTMVMQILAPVVTLVAQVFGLLWNVLSPIISVFQGVFGVITTLFGAMMGALSGLVDMIGWFFAPLFKVFDLLASAVGHAVKALGDLIISLVGWIPFFGKRIIDAIRPASTQGLAAASMAKVSNFGSLGETAAQNAFIATSGGIDPQEELAKQMLDNDIPNKWAQALDAQGNPIANPKIRRDDGFVGEGGGGNWNDGDAPLHGRNGAPIRMGM